MLISHLLAALNRWREYRRTIAELGGLSDRELADLGISRSDISSVARDAVAMH